MAEGIFIFRCNSKFYLTFGIKAILHAMLFSDFQFKKLFGIILYSLMAYGVMLIMELKFGPCIMILIYIYIYIYVN